jgi:hypothetical protein
MATWRELVEKEPELADAGSALLYQVGVGLAFLATVRRDGRPRLHPMCPLIHDKGLFAFIVPSPKQRDLRRDGLYAMHSFPCDDNEDAFHITGTARMVTDGSTRELLGRQFVAERTQFGAAFPAVDDALFTFDIDSVLLTRTTGHGDPAPNHRVWRP